MNHSSKPFQKVIVAYDDSPASRGALSAGIELCKLLGTPLETITVIEPPPAYTAFVVAAGPGVAQGLESDRKQHFNDIVQSAIAEGRRQSVEVIGHLLEAPEIDGVISFLRARRADLLVIGLRQHRSHVSRLWSTVASLEQEAPCSVLAIRAFSERTVERSLPDEHRSHLASQI
jgi:nucleotide-binding universal stress UspA family protein